MKKKVLIVDDNQELLKLLRLAFATGGFRVATAGNGIDALKKSRSFLPDAIILDLLLPEMDGFAVCETLRQQPETASLPILMVTGLTSQLARLAGLDSGGTELVTKPVRPGDLVAHIRRLLRKNRNGKSAPTPQVQAQAQVQTQTQILTQTKTRPVKSGK